MSSPNANLPGDNMINVSPVQSYGAELVVDNGAGSTFTYNLTTDVVSIPKNEADILTAQGLVQ
jgi:hypothetical protein